MQPPDGQAFYIPGVFREVAPPSGYGVPGDWPAETILSVTLEEHGDRRRMTVRKEGVPRVIRGRNEEGMGEALATLAEYLATATA